MLSRIRIIMIQFDSFVNASESLPVANEPIFAHEQPSVRGADEYTARCETSLTCRAAVDAASR